MSSKIINVLVPRSLKEKAVSETRTVSIQWVINDCLVAFDRDFEGELKEMKDTLDTEKLYISVAEKELEYLDYLEKRTGHSRTKIIRYLLGKRYSSRAKTGSEKQKV